MAENFESEMVNINLNGVNLKTVSKQRPYKYLGVWWAQDDHQFKIQAKSIRKKARTKFNAVNGLINGYSRLSPRLKIDLIYKQLIRPYMEYAQQLLIYDMEDMEKLKTSNV